VSKFLEQVLPANGWYFAATPAPSGKGWINTACEDLEDLQDKLDALDAAGKDAYFALAAFHRASYGVAEGDVVKTKRRTQENARALRCFWIDIDAGEGKPYADWREAFVALMAVCNHPKAEVWDDAKLPPPTHVVRSGNGIHAYWALETELPADQWRKVATKFKACVKALGIDADHGVTANSAGVLRPVGSTHRKDPDNPKTVTLLASTAPHPAPVFLKHVLAVAKAVAPSTFKAPAKSAFAAGIGEDYPPVSAHAMADQCPLFGAMRDTQGGGFHYDTWWHALRTLVHTEEAEDDDTLLHAWSQNDKYDADLTQRKIDEFRSGDFKPATCETLGEASSICDTCPHRGRINSPISLGIVAKTEKNPDVVDEETGLAKDEADTDFVPDMPGRLGKMFRWHPTKKLQRFNEYKPKANEDPPPYIEEFNGVPGWWERFSDVYFKVDFLWVDPTNENRATARVNMRTAPDRWEKTDIGLNLVGSGSHRLASEFSSLTGYTISTPHRAAFESYMQTWCEHIKAAAPDMNMLHRNMGWQDDGSFLHGTTLYCPDGSEKPAVVARNIARQADVYKPKGDLDRYTYLIDQLYNHPGREAHQLIWISAFASILPGLHDTQPIGFTISALSDGTGTGKTSAAYAGLGVWANPYANGQALHSANTTELGLATAAGEKRHLPMLVDETTTWTHDQLIRHVHKHSMGLYKTQAQAEGGLRDNSHLNWQSIMWLTSNDQPSAKIAARTANSAPMVARLFEVKFPNIDLNRASPHGDAMLKELLRDHTGLAGRKFAKALAKMKPGVVRKLIEQRIAEINSEVRATSGARYWVRLVAYLQIAFRMTKHLGLHSFDAKRFDALLEETIRNMMDVTEEYSEDAADIMSKLLQDISQGLIVTETLKTPSERHARDNVVTAPRRNVQGRVVLTGPHKGAYIPVTTVRHWCAEHDYNPHELRKQMLNRKWLVSDDKRFSLGVGTPYTAGRSRVWYLTMDAVTGVLEDDRERNQGGTPLVDQLSEAENAVESLPEPSKPPEDFDGAVTDLMGVD